MRGLLTTFRRPNDTDPELSSAEAKLAGLRTRAESAAARLADAKAKLHERKNHLDALAEDGQELAAEARAVLELESELKAVELELSPLTAAIARAEAAVVDLKTQRHRASCDAEIEQLSAEIEEKKSAAADAVRKLSEIGEDLYALDRLKDQIATERDGMRSVFTSKPLYEDGMMRTFLEAASKDRPVRALPEEAPSAGRFTIAVNLSLLSPQVRARALRAERDGKRAA